MNIHLSFVLRQSDCLNVVTSSVIRVLTDKRLLKSQARYYIPLGAHISDTVTFQKLTIQVDPSLSQHYKTNLNLKYDQTKKTSEYLNTISNSSSASKYYNLSSESIPPGPYSHTHPPFNHRTPTHGVQCSLSKARLPVWSDPGIQYEVS